MSQNNDSDTKIFCRQRACRRRIEPPSFRFHTASLTRLQRLDLTTGSGWMETKKTWVVSREPFWRQHLPDALCFETSSSLSRDQKLRRALEINTQSFLSLLGQSGVRVRGTFIDSCLCSRTTSILFSSQVRMKIWILARSDRQTRVTQTCIESFTKCSIDPPHIFREPSKFSGLNTCAKENLFWCSVHCVSFPLLLSS